MDTLLGFPLPPDAHVERALSLMPASDFHEAAFPPERPFHVETTFVGRAEALSALVDFARTPDRRRVAVVQGGGGSGKTSLLGAFLAALASPRVGVSVRCATDAPGGAPWLHRLPPGPCLVVMDDAHRRGSLTSLLPLARERDDVRLVLAVRPAGLPRIGSLLSQVGIEADEAAVLPPLSPLEPTEAEALAREVLGPEHAAHAPALAAASAGHPFVIVLGGRLIQEGALHPVALDPAADLAARVRAIRAVAALARSIARRPGLDPRVRADFQIHAATAVREVGGELVGGELMDFVAGAPESGTAPGILVSTAALAGLTAETTPIGDEGPIHYVRLALDSAIEPAAGAPTLR